MAKLLPSSNSSIVKYQKSSVVKPDKFLNVKTKTTAVKGEVAKDSPKLLRSSLSDIEKKVIQIDKLLKDSLFLSKKEEETKRKGKEKEKFEGKEKELEKKKPSAIKGIKLPSLPKMGFLDWIKNFITQTILGFFAVRLIDFLPQLLKILPVIINVGDFFIDVGGKMLDGLITFVDWGYKAIDGTRQFIKQLGGEGLAKNFDKFAGAIDNVIEIAIIAALATADSGGGGDLLDFAGDFFKKRGAQQAATTVGQQAAGAAGRTAGVGAGAAAGIVAGVGLLSSALGEGAFQVRKVVIKPIQNLENEYKKDKNPFTKIGRGIVLNMVRPLYGVFSTVGFLLDVVGAPFRYAIELLRYPFLSEEDKVKQANNLAKFDARIREDLRKALNMLPLGFAFKEKGSFGNIYGNKGAQTEMMSKMAGGGKATQTPSRSIKKKKKTRSISFTPRKIKPGINAGGEDKVQKLFPNPKKPSGMFGFLGGLFGGGNQQNQEQPKKPTEKSANPQEFLVKSNDVLGKSDFFGPFFTLAIKTVLGQKPDILDYKNAGRGLNTWMQTTFKSGALGFAGGGEVDAKQFFEGEDYTDIIAKSVEESVSKEVNATIRDLAKELSLRPVGREEMIRENIRRAEESQEVGGQMGDATLSESEMDLFQRLIVAESGGQGLIGQALVARSVLNRAGLIQSGKASKGTFSAKSSTVTGVITGRGQYQPYADGNPNGSINKVRTPAQMNAAKEAIKLAQNPERLRGLLKSEGIDDGSIKKLLAATGFRAGYAFSDPSQNVNVVKYKDHYFNTAGNTALIVVSSQVSEKISPVSLKGGDGRFIQGNSGRSYGTHFHIGTTKPGDGSGVATAGFNTIKHFLGKKSVFVGRSKEFIPANATDEQIRGYIARGQSAHRQTELDLQIGGLGAGNKVAFPLALKGIRYSSTDGYGVSADIVGVNAFVGHGRYKPDGSLAAQQGQPLNVGAPDFYAFH